MFFARKCWKMINPIEFNGDQRRESVNTQQRFAAWRESAEHARSYRGSMVWDQSHGNAYLLRAYYDDSGVRRQKSLGPKSAETEHIKEAFDKGREISANRRKDLRAALDRQAAINRAVGLGRVPLLTARILRALDEEGLIGAGVRVAGTNALFAYEAAAGVMFDSSITATDDIDLLFDSRARLRLVAGKDVATRGLIGLLQRLDKSFRKSGQAFRAANGDGYLVDLIKPSRNPPWKRDRQALGDEDDPEAVKIEGLVWLENAPPFEQVAIDEKGAPLRLIVPDPRVFAIHKHWLAGRADRDSVKRRRDEAQAFAVASLVCEYFRDLPFDPGALTFLPRAVVDAALRDFGAAAA